MVPLIWAVPPQVVVEPLLLRVVGPFTLPVSASSACTRKPEIPSVCGPLGYSCNMVTCQLPVSGPFAAGLGDDDPQAVRAIKQPNKVRTNHSFARVLTNLPNTT
jgi:hypothetical protein